MPLIEFPNVPNVPGVPALLRSATVPTPGAIFQDVVAGGARALFGATVWGIFDQAGAIALEPDSFVAMDYRNSNAVANYPMEAGAFSSYNKVANPYETTVYMTIGADKAARTAFLAKLERMAAGLDLFSVVTPEATYINANLTDFDYKRSADKGMSLITVALRFMQIRLTAVSTSTRNTADASGMDVTDVGQIQTAEPSQSQIDAAEVTA